MDLIMFPVLYVATYAALFVLVPIFFGQPVPQPRIGSLYSIAYAVVAIVIAFIATDYFPDPELGNRLLHMIGGGMLAFLLYYRVMNDTGIRIPRVQFFMLGFLIVIALGVANEHLEFLLQILNIRVFANTPTDTWLDLMSNSIGAVCAGLFFTYVWTPTNPTDDTHS